MLFHDKRHLLFFLICALICTGASIALAEEPPASSPDANAGSSVSFRVYVVREGDTLFGIAGQTRIYNNPLKWPLIYYFNREEFRQIKVPPQALPVTSLPPGTALAIVLPAEAEKRAVRQQAEGKPWAVNIMSSTDAGDLVPLAIRLIDTGRFTYISEWTFREKRWKRLRIGFFKDREAAIESARMVLEELGLPNCWVVRAEWSELVEFGGFAD